MTYNVTDSSGNAATEVTRTVNVTDTTAPVITLVGDTQITVEVGTTYTDLGLQHQIIMMVILQLI